MKLTLTSFAMLLVYTALHAQTPERLKKVTIGYYEPANQAYQFVDSTMFDYNKNSPGFLRNEIFYGENHPWIDFRTYNLPPYIDIPPYMYFNEELQYSQAATYLHGGVNSPALNKFTQTIKNNAIEDYRAEQYMPPAQSWTTVYSIFNTYNNVNMVQQLVQHNNGDTLDYRYVYRNAYLMDSVITKRRSSVTTIHPTTIGKYIYSNNFTLLEVDFYSNNKLFQKTYFSYGSSNMPTQITTTNFNVNDLKWDTIQVRRYTYNTAKQLTKSEYFDGTRWLYTVEAKYDNSNNRVEDVIYFDFYKNGSNRGREKCTRKLYEYNTSGRINKFWVESWNKDSSDWKLSVDSLFGSAPLVYLDYGIYWPQDVPGIMQGDNNISIYPSPAAGLLTVKAEGLQPGTLDVGIYSATGQMIRTWKDENPTGDYHRTIPVQELPAGTYIFKLEGRNVSAAKRFSVVH